MKQRGFTLIELIIVIVVLGILAVTAAPRFIDFQGDARRATLEGVKTAMKGGAQLVYAKAAIAGLQDSSINNNSQTVTIRDQDVPTIYGYPRAGGMTTAAILKAWLNLDVKMYNDNSAEAEWNAIVGSRTDGSTPPTGAFAIYPSGYAYQGSGEKADACQIIYQSAQNEDGPTVSIEGEGC